MPATRIVASVDVGLFRLVSFMLRTVHLIHPASPRVSRPKPEVTLPRTLASPWTGLAPASYRELVARLRHFYLLVLMTSELLDARVSRLSIQISCR